MYLSKHEQHIGGMGIGAKVEGAQVDLSLAIYGTRSCRVWSEFHGRSGDFVQRSRFGRKGRREG